MQNKEQLQNIYSGLLMNIRNTAHDGYIQFKKHCAFSVDPPHAKEEATKKVQECNEYLDTDDEIILNDLELLNCTNTPFLQNLDFKNYVKNALDRKFENYTGIALKCDELLKQLDTQK